MAIDWFNLDGKVALVTGSDTGIGAAIAKALARAGADVLCHSLGDEALETSEQIRALGRRSLPLSGDLSQRAAQDALITKAAGAYGRIDILVNNAGMIRRAPAVDYSDADWDLVLEVNLSAPFRLSRGVGKLMLEQGGGRIVNIASLLAFQGGILVPAYAASKGGVAQFTKALANEWAAKGSTSTPSPPATSPPTTPPRCAPTRCAAARSSSASRPGAGARPTTSLARRSSSARTRPATSTATSCWSTAAGWLAEGRFSFDRESARARTWAPAGGLPRRPRDMPTRKR